MAGDRIPIRVGHSPDPGRRVHVLRVGQGQNRHGTLLLSHELVDIETLNRRALQGELELTAVSLHAYAYLTHHYMLCDCGASMGDGYGPMVVTRSPCSIDELAKRTIAVPGTLTTAYLSLRMCLGAEFRFVVVPFDRILDATAAGSYEGHAVDAGLVIHEGQLTYQTQQLVRVVDLGEWWKRETNLPLPLGANGIRKNLGPTVMTDVNRLLFQSIEYGLQHRQDALTYALGFGRGLETSQGDLFVGMYVNDWTLDFGPRAAKQSGSSCSAATSAAYYLRELNRNS